MNVVEQARQNVRELNERLRESKLPLVAQFISMAILNEEMIAELAEEYTRKVVTLIDNTERIRRRLLAGKVELDTSNIGDACQRINAQLWHLFKIREMYAQGQLIGE